MFANKYEVVFGLISSYVFSIVHCETNLPFNKTAC